MWFNVCVNDMVPFGPFAAFIKGCITFYSSDRNEVNPQDNMAKPQGVKVFTVERYGLPEDFVHIRFLCDVQSSPLVFAPNRAFVCGPLQRQAPGKTLCFMSALS